MKKSVLKFFAGLTLAGLFTGCSWQIPQKVSVKTKAEYNFNIGTFSKSLDSVIGVDKIKSALPADQGFYLYDYNPDGKSTKKQFVIKKNIAEVPVDLSSYMMELTSDIDPVSFKISIPKVNESKTVSVDASSVSNSISGLVKFAGEYAPESTITGIPEGTEAFECFEYSSGKMTVYLGGKIVPAVCDPFASIELSHDGETIASATFTALGASEVKTITVASNTIEVPVTYKAEIDLAGKKVYMRGMKFSFTGVVNAEFFCGEVAADSVIAKASGITINNYNVSVDNQTISNLLPDGIESVVLGGGTLDASVKLPDGWKNVTLNLSYDVSGAMELSGTGTSDLKNVSMTKGDLVFKPTIKLNIRNGEMDFTKKPEVKLALNITEFSEVTIDTDAFGIKTSYDVADIALPSNVTDIVKEIWFGESEFTFVTKNTLPVGNDVSITCNSILLRFEDKTVELVSGGEEVTKKMKSSPQEVTGPGTNTEGAKIDFAVSVALPGKNGTKATFKNLVPGTDYEISVAVTPKIEWNKMILDINALGLQNLSSSIDTGFSLSSFTDSLPESQSEMLKKIDIASIPVYLFCHVPDMNIFNNIKFNGKISFQADDSVYLLGNETQSKDLVYQGITVPELNADENGVVTINLDSFTSSCKADLASVLSLSSKNNIKVNYDLAISGVSGSGVALTPEDVKQSGNLEVSAFLVLPLALNVKEDISVDVMNIMNKTGDLLGRSEGFNVSEYEKYFGLVDSAAVKVKANLPFAYTDAAKDIKIKVDLYKGSSDPEAPKPFEISLSDLSLSLTSSEILYLLKNLTNPDIQVVVPEGTVELKQKLDLNALIGVQLKTDGQIPVFEL